MKSALMSTAGPSFADTSLTQEASVIVAGRRPRKRRRRRQAVRSSPTRSRSRSATSSPEEARTRKSISVTVSDAGDGAGTWTAEVQAAGCVRRARRSRPHPSRSRRAAAPIVQIVARASAGAVQGDNFGFVVLRRGSDVRRIPYAFSVSRSSLTGARVTALKTLQSGDTRAGEDRARVYRWPTSPFSILGIFGVDPSVNDDGKEKIYSLDITKQAVNAGVVVVKPVPKLNASDHGAPELEPADPSVVHRLARRERRPRAMRESRSTSTASCPTSSTRSAPRAAFPPAGQVLRLRRLGTRPVQRAFARRQVHAPRRGSTTSSHRRSRS